MCLSSTATPATAGLAAHACTAATGYPPCGNQRLVLLEGLADAHHPLPEVGEHDDAATSAASLAARARALQERMCWRATHQAC